MSNYDNWSAKELEQTADRLQHMVGAQTMMIEELRESLSNQVDLIEALESDRDAWKAKESKCAASYYNLKGEYQELQNNYAVQSEKLKHTDASRIFYIDCHTAQVKTIARLYKELDAANARADANQLDSEDESESRDKLYNELKELKARYNLLKDTNNRMHEALDTIHELSE